MIRAEVAETQLFDSWGQYQKALIRGIAPLTDEQMQSRLVPGQRSPGEIAEHIVFGRALWYCRLTGETLPELAPLLLWDNADDPPHTAAEVVAGLELTWRLYTEVLMRGEPTSEVAEKDHELLQTIWAMLDHDLPHAGELSFVLGGLGLPGVGY